MTETEIKARALLQDLLNQFPEFDTDEPIAGTDAVEFLGKMYADAKALLAPKATRTAVLYDENMTEIFRGHPADMPVRFVDDGGGADTIDWTMREAVIGGTPQSIDTDEDLAIHGEGLPETHGEGLPMTHGEGLPETVTAKSDTLPVLRCHNRLQELSYIVIEVGHSGLANRLVERLLKDDWIGPVLSITIGHGEDVWLINNMAFDADEALKIQNAVDQWLIEVEGTIPEDEVTRNTRTSHGKDQLVVFAEQWKARTPLVTEQQSD